MISVTRTLMSAFEAVNGPGKIDPHDGQEIQRMRNGTKPICMLGFPHERDIIEPLLDDVATGKINLLKQHEPNDGTAESFTAKYFFYQNGQEKNLAQLIEKLDTTPKDYTEHKARAASIGTLLGYTKQDIDMFFKWGASNTLRSFEKIANTQIYDKASQLINPIPPYDPTPMPAESKIPAHKIHTDVTALTESTQYTSPSPPSQK